VEIHRTPAHIKHKLVQLAELMLKKNEAAQHAHGQRLAAHMAPSRCAPPSADNASPLHRARARARRGGAHAPSPWRHAWWQA